MSQDQEVKPVKSCCGGHTEAKVSVLHIDPVCGMTVDAAKGKPEVLLEGKTFHFCCQGCANKFSANPDKYLNKTLDQQSGSNSSELGQATRSTIATAERAPSDAKQSYTCPMHPEVVQQHPGSCPSCGMALEAMIPGAAGTDEGVQAEAKDIAHRLSLSAALTVPIILINMSQMLGTDTMSGTKVLVNLWAEFLLASPIVFYAAQPIFQRGWSSLKHRSLNMFTLLSLGIGLPFLVSFAILIALTLHGSHIMGAPQVYCESAAVIATLAWLGQYLELRARVKSGSAIGDLVSMMPANASVIAADGSDVLTPISDLQPLARLRTRPGERIAADGRVLEGESSVNESMITGESLPSFKQPGSTVLAGTVNGSGSLVIEAERVADETMLSQIVKLVGQAQRSRVPVQQLVDKVAAVFVPTVIAIALSTFAIWMVSGATTSAALQYAISVVVVACPCALGLATPMSIIVASGRAARAGVLFKEARALQLLAQIDTLIIDKTGTLTEGTPRLAGIFTTFSYSQQQLLIMSASLERQSEHPLANAIVKASSGSRLLPVSNFSSSAGRGIAGTVSGKSLVIGTEKYLSGLKIACSHFQAEQPPTKDTLTSVFVAVDEECVGRLDFEDNIRQGAAESLKKLRELGIKTILATGDKETVARQVAGALGIGEVHAAQLPQDKAALVKSLREKGAKVAMAGDGINDAPALAQADVGIAMASATDVAMHSADIVIVKSDIEGIVRAYKISKAMLQNIRQNLVLAFGYNLVAIPLAAGLFAKSMGFGIDPMIAAAAMSLSSVAVIANALRLRRLSL